MDPRTRRLILVTLAALGALALMSIPASAQIYARQDANGTLVLSDRPLGPDARAFEVPGARGIRTTRPADRRRATSYDAIVESYASAHRVRPELVHAVIQVESGLDRFARSPKGAMGLMQLMPATASTYGVRDPYDPEQNIGAGVAYLRDLLDRFEQNEELALAAYNAGPAAVQRHGHAVPPFRETRDYVRRIKGRTTVATEEPGGIRIYKTWELIDGRPVARYSNIRPVGVEFEVVPLR